MKVRYQIFIVALFLALITGCAKTITVGMINRSTATILVHYRDSIVPCEPGQMVSFTPGSPNPNHDIMITAQSKKVAYDLQPLAYSFLDFKNDKRILLALQDDLKLYVLEPTDRPLEGTVKDQPPNYPLIPLGVGAKDN